MQATSVIPKTGLYHEVRGSGPSVLLIAGGGGDAGKYTRAAERLADEFTVITYDRRGNSRSASPTEGAAAAAIAAQAADAAGLIREAGFDQAAVFGGSGGGIIALEIAASDPGVLRGAIVHEPPLLYLLPRADGPDPLAALFELAQTDPRAAAEQFLRQAITDPTWEAAPRDLRERMLSNGAQLFRHELPAFFDYRANLATIRSNETTIVPARGKDGLSYGPAVQARLEQELRVTGAMLSGNHAPYLADPEVFAEEIRAILRGLWAA